jgi:hypothetical protein
MHLLLVSQECLPKVFVSCGAGVASYDTVSVIFLVKVIAVKVEVVVEFFKRSTRICNSRSKRGGADVLLRGRSTGNSTHILIDPFL